MTTTAPIEKALLAVLSTQGSVFGTRVEPSMLAHRIPPSIEKQRDLLGDLLISSNDCWDEETLSLLDNVWKKESEESESKGILVPWETIPNCITVIRDANSMKTETKVGVWKGDITTLVIEGITNAANDQGLGCYIPNHRCIDNVIHRVAGPRLRITCRTSMRERGSQLSAGTPPIVTSGFFLPSTYVLHVTGPQISYYEKVSKTDLDNLRKAYEHCLDACAENRIRTLAFCGISTGIFGFPKYEACKIAIAAVVNWLHSNSTELDAVIFDVFSDEEELMYNDQLSKVLRHQISTS